MYNSNVYKVNTLLDLPSKNLQMINDGIKGFSTNQIEFLLEYLASGCSNDFLFYKTGTLSLYDMAGNLQKVRQWSDTLNKFDEMIKKINDFKYSKEKLRKSLILLKEGCYV